MPRPHAFSYAVCMVWLDLAELDEVFRGRWFWSTQRSTLAWMKRADYLGDPALSLDEAVRRRAAELTGRRPAGAIRMLSQLRSFGHCFNPVTFYYCYARDGVTLDVIVAEITNTPWRERHSYVLPVDAAATSAAHRFDFAKAFHVSPFMPMQQDYRWSFTAPRDRLAVHMDNLQGARKVFDATLVLTRVEISTRSLAMALLRWPASTLAVLVSIYWQALRLKLKRVPFHPRPHAGEARG